MADLQQIQQQTQQARELANQKRAETEAIKSQLESQQRAIPDINSRQALIQKYSGLQGRNLRQQIEQTRNVIGQKLQDVSQYQNEIILPYEKQIGQTETQIADFQEKERALQTAERAFDNKVPYAFVEGLAGKYLKQMYEQERSSKEFQADLNKAIDEYNTGATEQEAFKGMNLEYLKRKGIVTFSTVDINKEANNFSQNLNIDNLSGTQDMLNKLGDRNLIIDSYSSGVGNLPLVSAKSLNVSPSYGSNGFGSITGNAIGFNSSLDSQQLNRTGSSSWGSRFADTVKTVFQQKTGQVELPTKLGGITTVSASPTIGQTIAITRAYTPQELQAQYPMSGLGISGNLDVASQKIGRFAGNVVTQVLTPLQMNPNAGQLGQRTFTQGSPTQTIFTIPESRIQTQGLPSQVRGSSAPNSPFQFTQTQISPSRKVTAQDIGSATKKVITTGTRIAPYFVPYAGQSLFFAEVGQSVSPLIKERGLWLGAKQFAKEQPLQTLGILGLGAIGGVKAFSYGTRPITTISRGTPFLESQKYFITQSTRGRGITYQAEQLVRIPKRIETTDTRFKKLGRGALNLFFGEMSPASKIKGLKPVTKQVTPTIKYRSTFEAPITKFDDFLSVRGSVRTQRILPEQTRFGEFKRRDTSSNLLEIRVRAGKSLTPDVSGVGEITQGATQSFFLPTKQLRRITQRPNALTLFQRQEARLGGRRVNINLGLNGLESASMFRPTPRTQLVRAERVFSAQNVPTSRGVFDLEVFRQGGITLRKSGSNLIVNPKLQKGILNIAVPKSRQIDFVPIRQETGLPSPSNLIQTSSQTTKQFASLLPTDISQLQLVNAKVTPVRIVKTATPQQIFPVVRSPTTQTNILSSEAQVLSPQTKQSNIVSSVLGTPQSNRVESNLSLGTNSLSNQKASFNEFSRIVDLTAQVPVQRISQAQRVRSATQNILQTVQETRTPRNPTTRTTFMPRINNKALPKKITGFGDFGFNVAVRRRGKDILVGKARTKEEARNILFKTLKSNLSASGFVSQRGQKVKIDTFGEFTSSKKDPFRVVQARGFRLGTGSERAEIKSAKRLSKQFFTGFGSNQTAKKARSIKWF